MFHEYALEPAVLSSWDRTRFFLDAFGPWKGRFLARYPKTWKRMVFEGLACPEVEKKRIIERLRALDERAFGPRRDARYDPEQDWLSNAKLEHEREPFHAIIAAQAGSPDHVVDGGQLDEQDARWNVPSGRLVSRDPASFVDAVRLLLRASKRVVFVDPYFRADQYDKRGPLLAFCEVVGAAATVEMHVSERSLSYSFSMDAAARVLPSLLPTGARITLHCWRERAGGARLHNRYLLTDVGGVKFGDGIEVGGRGEQDHLSILDEPSRATLWSQYVGPEPAFDSGGLPREFVSRR